MGVPYEFFYRIGFHPWEDLAEHPPFADKLSELLDREESGREPPYGPALDLGCGSGVWGLRLPIGARHRHLPRARRCPARDDG